MKCRMVAAMVSFLLPSCISYIEHDETAAAKAATQFADAAFVDRDFAKAHKLATSEITQRFSDEGLADVVAKMHPDSFPTRVTATEFEPVPGQRGMFIYLNGEGDGPGFYYRFVMTGDKPSGYRVSGFFRGNAPYPPSSRRPLK